jgi:long-chain acyl-CoA synthetase
MYHVTNFAEAEPQRAAAIFPSTGATIRFGELDANANRAANAMLSLGLRRGDCVGISITNRPEFLYAMLGAQRIGLYYVLLSTKLSVDDLAYIIDDAQASATIISDGCFAAGNVEGLSRLSGRLCLIDLPGAGHSDWSALTALAPATLPPSPSRGREMLYSSGTTGRPKGVRKPLPDGDFAAKDPINLAVAASSRMGPESVFLSPCPQYHAAPHRFANAALHAGATLVIPGHFEALATLQAIDTYGCTHSLWVPTMFHRLLQLPEAERLAVDLSTHRHAIHGAAPCPVHVKERMIDWWGPILDEYYSGSEGIGSTNITSQEWLAHKGSVGTPTGCKLHVLGADGAEVAPGTIGDIYFESSNIFEYWKDADKTSKITNKAGWKTFGDIGYVDDEGYLYLTDRRHFTIISGGVNIYPQEIESVLLEHQAVNDVAVFGIADGEFGEIAVAVVQLVGEAPASRETEKTLRAYVKARLGPVKTPKSIFFEKDFPRHETGKIYKQGLIQKYS